MSFRVRNRILARAISLLGAAALAGAVLASAAEPTDSAPDDETATEWLPVTDEVTTGPPDSAPRTADPVTWDESGESAGDHDHLGPESEGHADSASPQYTVSGYTWERTALTYGFDNWTPDVSVSQQKAAAAAAFDRWAAVTPLTFREVADCGLAFNHPSCTTPDIRIRFGSGDHGMGSSDPNFDGTGGTVAHAYGPNLDAWNYTAGGDIHLDEAETWRVNGSFLDLQTVLLHETGHALGLNHTNRSCSGAPGPNRPIMCSVLTGAQRVLSSDDISGIQSLYGQNRPDLPDGLTVDILDPASGGTETSANVHKVKIVNGYDDDLSGTAMKVDGVSGCNRTGFAVPANSVAYTTCRINPDTYLTGMDTSEEVTLTATLSASGMPDTSDGPVVVPVVADDNPFTDVPAWVKPAVDWITYWDLAKGFPDSTYRPDHAITRAQVVNMLWRHAGKPTPGGSHGFSDVPAWVDDAVTWAAYDPAGVAQPLVTGFPDGTFRPNAPIVRAEVVRLLYRYVGSPTGGASSHNFSDVPPWVEDAVTWAAHDPDGSGPLESVIAGFPDNTFRPNNHITRAQLTRSLYRLTDQLVD